MFYLSSRHVSPTTPHDSSCAASLSRAFFSCLRNPLCPLSFSSGGWLRSCLGVQSPELSFSLFFSSAYYQRTTDSVPVSALNMAG
mmetsp:Transcript_27880/g.85560  ORF Transcript_27880/g.85560 Transcript_27880/m.85560 type:complete len:85 (+) Transcript_27880:1687-1941(+)